MKPTPSILHVPDPITYDTPLGTLVLSDQDALSRFVQSADPRAFEVLAKRYQNMVLATCQRVLRQAADADDATQETFLKLAQHAKDIKSNIAAWLHSCAIRTSLDILRRKSAQSRVIINAAQNQTSTELTNDDRQAWADLELHIDQALESLSLEDRELIIARFLAGRTQAELAAEANIHPGTMHRRIDSALDKLRAGLSGKGFVISGASLTAALAFAPEAVTVNSALAAGLGKLALSQLANTSVATPAAVVATASAPSMFAWIATAAAALVIIGSGLMLAMPSSARSQAQTPPAKPLATPAGQQANTDPTSRIPDGKGFPQPTKETKPHALVDILAEGDEHMRLLVDGNKLLAGVKAEPNGKVSSSLAFEIKSISPESNPPKMTLLCTAVAEDVKNGMNSMLNQTFNVTYQTTENKFIISGLLPKRSPEGPPPNAVAVRPAPGSKMTLTGQSEGNHPSITGTWVALNEMALKLDQQDITILDAEGSFVLERHRVLQWTETPEYAKVQTICNAYVMGRGSVGKRFKFLIKKIESGYAILGYEHWSTKRDTFPDSFTYTPNTQLRLMVFKTQ